jgi:hypothetical protein
MSTKPDLPFGVESDTDEAEKEEEAVPNTNCPGTKPLDTAESLQPQGDKLAEERTWQLLISPALTGHIFWYLPLGLYDATLMGVSWHQYATLLVLILYTCHDKG